MRAHWRGMTKVADDPGKGPDLVLTGRASPREMGLERRRFGRVEDTERVERRSLLDLVRQTLMPHSEPPQKRELILAPSHHH